MEKYYVIHNSDGDTTVYSYTKEELLEMLNDDEENDKYFDEIPFEVDTNYWGEGTLIIRGKIVKPKEKKIVVNFDID